MSYRTIAEGVRRTFVITVGLKRGYHSQTIQHPQTAHQIMAEWLKKRLQNQDIVVSGAFVDATIVYVYEVGGELKSGSEPALRLWGDISLRRLANVSDSEIKEVIFNLADTLGRELDQKHVTVSYRDDYYVRELIESAGND